MGFSLGEGGQMLRWLVFGPTGIDGAWPAHQDDVHRADPGNHGHVRHGRVLAEVAVCGHEARQ